MPTLPKPNSAVTGVPVADPRAAQRHFENAVIA